MEWGWDRVVYTVIMVVCIGGGVWADATYIMINLNYTYVILRCLSVMHACLSATKAPNATPLVPRMMEKDRNGDMGV